MGVDHVSEFCNWRVGDRGVQGTQFRHLSSGGRFHERAAQYLQGVGPNVISRFNNRLSVF
jgi:hypothetical protein